MVTLRALVSALEDLAPLRLAESWDNVGLLAGDPAQEVKRVLFTIDLTRDVVAEMVATGADAVVSYHPPIFTPLKRIPAEGALAEALRRGFAIYSPHTALDSALGGTNDVLADAVGLLERAPIRPAAATDREHKLVTFVPEEAVARVSEALFEAGAGRIGAYSSCSFRSAGMGTFFGEAGAQPVVGQAGRLETAPEVRLETVVPIAATSAVIAALRRTHPYEEPAFDLVRLAPAPQREGEARVGMGRIGSIAPVPLAELVAHVKASLALDGVLVAGPDRVVKRVAVAAGSAGDLVKDAARLGADVVVTGEVRHHDALDAVARGVTLIATLHSRSERPTLAHLAKHVEERVPGVTCVQSARDVDPLRFA